MKKLTEEEIQKNLKRLSGWFVKEGKLKKEFTFKDFKQAVAFMNEVSETAEKENHHPDMNLHDYNKVEISLKTHEAGGLTEKDFSVLSRIRNTLKPQNDGLRTGLRRMSLLAVDTIESGAKIHGLGDEEIEMMLKDVNSLLKEN